MEKSRVVAWIYSFSAGQLDLLKKQQRAEEKATIEALVREGKEKREARIIVARMRPTEWPPLEELVAGAVERRLGDPDLAGPWRPLTESEQEQLALSGRWPGPNSGISMSQRSYLLPTELVTRLRTAAWRVSEGPYKRLYSLGLVGAGVRLDQSQRRLRDELAEQLYPPGRIIREALVRYGPRSSEAEQN